MVSVSFILTHKLLAKSLSKETPPAVKGVPWTIGLLAKATLVILNSLLNSSPLSSFVFMCFCNGTVLIDTILHKIVS